MYVHTHLWKASRVHSYTSEFYEFKFILYGPIFAQYWLCQRFVNNCGRLENTLEGIVVIDKFRQFIAEEFKQINRLIHTTIERN